MQAVNIGILGLGTVGGGTAQVLQDNAAEISKRLGREVRVTAVCTSNANRAKELCPQAAVVSEPTDLVTREDVDIVVELYGGTGVAKEVVLQAIGNGKHIVTANKKLLAEYGNEIFELAEQKNVMVYFEAAVAGGIPIIKTLREGLAANRIHSIAGIINGTSNFILSEMREKGAAFADVLAQAQKLGYAEADPTFDIEGHDAGHKITIMSALAFGTPVNFGACYLEGISKLDSRDIKYAEELGYRIKLLGITRCTEKGIELRVHPTLLPESRLLANVNGVMNAVRVKADMVGETMYYGAGAGSLPTASAVVADIIDICRNIGAGQDNRVPHLSFQSSQVKPQKFLTIDEITSSYYLRVQAADEAGVLGKIATLLAEQGVSIEALIQKGVLDCTHAEIVILTHSTVEKNIKNAIAAIEQQAFVSEKVTMIRMESLHG
ncbi:homoserine dehydrogenase [Kingella negevensis]|uniref:Homoserine dehydrogenase n=1 Tax=Kingella negevensis TaxID=1522312 RepID=A0A238T8M7_9NEIS|nr:homoserine dehydrogenase [Kingella negevensis]MDK4680287.1 homoserine dehydrogenase [Kingella negevensis]MDK4681993.1 homoserine dehydrogenase [Kingella negevensis]MDK4684699.1 homoserine dehydrogenase [Kingella negevensis]MDK4690189.1 homoserine dehydrogenase [Kingella negevensis]MDK4692466.1 homoserine dehydrogenase [Kingella negevensis]